MTLNIQNYLPSNEVSKKVKLHRKKYKNKHDELNYYKRKARKSRNSKLDYNNTDMCWNCEKTGHLLGNVEPLIKRKIR